MIASIAYTYKPFAVKCFHKAFAVKCYRNELEVLHEKLLLENISLFSQYIIIVGRPTEPTFKELLDMYEKFSKHYSPAKYIILNKNANIRVIKRASTFPCTLR